MSKKQCHLADISDILDSSATLKVQENLNSYIIKNSNLPGPRGNLELATAFEEAIFQRTTTDSAKDLWILCVTMTSLSVEDAPVNDPRVLIPFCGTLGLGAIGAAHPRRRMKSLLHLRTLAADSRWRMREAVAMALCKLLTTGDAQIREETERWIEEGNWLVMRAALAGIAEPSLLGDSSFVDWALAVHKKALDRILTASDRKSSEFKTLRQALGYTLSVIVQAAPVPGFLLLESQLKMDDSDINWIVRQNLKKKRLATRFPTEVDSLLQRV